MTTINATTPLENTASTVAAMSMPKDSHGDNTTSTTTIASSSNMLLHIWDDPHGGDHNDDNDNNDNMININNDTKRLVVRSFCLKSSSVASFDWLLPSSSTGTQSDDDNNNHDVVVWSVSEIATVNMTNNNNNRYINMIKLLWRWPHRIGTLWMQIATDLFLPIGYPHTVRPGYGQYQFYDSVQGLCSYLRGVLCHAAVLHAVGVGNAEATALAAALSWAIKDGLALLGGLLFSYIASSHFDSAVKEFRFFADFINNVALTLDMLAPIAGQHSATTLLWISAISSLCKTACGISAGATKSSITQHFAQAGNMADLNAKEATQETAVSLVGMILGMLLARQLHIQQQQQQDPNLQGNTTAINIDWIQWTLFVFLTAVHMYTNYHGVDLLRLRTLNRQRTHEVMTPTVMHLTERILTSKLEDWFMATTRITTKDMLNYDWELLPPPEQVHESLLQSVCGVLGLTSTTSSQGYGMIDWNAPLADVVQAAAALDSGTGLVPQSEPQGGSVRVPAIDDAPPRSPQWWLLQEFQHERYVLIPSLVQRRWGKWQGSTMVCIRVALLHGANNATQLSAYLHARLLLECCYSNKNGMTWKDCSTDLIEKGLRSWLTKTHQIVQDLCHGGTAASSNRLLDRLTEVGWEVQPPDHRLYLGFSRRRSRWNIQPSLQPPTDMVMPIMGKQATNAVVVMKDKQI